jgi:hypothetical protein
MNNPEDLKEYVFHFLKAYLELDYNYNVDSEVFQERFNHCKTCEHFNPEKVKCKECGCHLPSKLLEAFENCPVDKWGIDMKSFKNKHYAEITGTMPPEFIGYEITNE